MIPRKHLKTCQVTIGWTIWMWLKNPNLRIAIGSATEKLAKEIISEIQSHITDNPNFTSLFGNWKSERRWTNIGFDIAPRTKIGKDLSCAVFSVGKAVTGKHYDVIILDDLAIRQNSVSHLMRQKQKDLYADCENVVVKDEIDYGEQDGIILAVGTRWHFDDIYNYLLYECGDILDFVVDRPCIENDTLKIKDPEGWRRNIKQVFAHPDTTVLFEQKNSLKSLKAKYRKAGTYEFSCQQMNFPVSDEKAAFKAEDMQFCDLKKVPANLQKYLLVDPAGDESEYSKADDWAAVTIGIAPSTPLDEIYIFGVKAESNISSNKFMTMMEIEDAKYGPSYIGIEANFSRTYIKIFKKAFPHLQRKVRAIKTKNTKSKRMKILGLQPYTENFKLIFVIDEDGKEKNFCGKQIKLSEGKQKLLNQIVDYGNEAHDDCVDALSNIIEIIRPTRVKKEDPKYEWNPRDPRTGY